MEEGLFEKVEHLARELKVSRSRIFVIAIEDFIHQQENRRLLESINQAYEEGPDSVEENRLRRARSNHRRIVEGEW